MIEVRGNMKYVHLVRSIRPMNINVDHDQIQRNYTLTVTIQLFTFAHSCFTQSLVTNQQDPCKSQN